MNNINYEHITFTGSKFVFTRMQILTWVTNGLGSVSLIEKNSMDLLADIILNFHKEKPIVIYFKGIIDIDDHALDGFFDSLNNNNRQVIILEGNHLSPRINQLKKTSNANFTENKDKKYISIGKELLVDLKEIEIERNELKENFIIDTIKDCFEKFEIERRLSSTPLIKANGEYNSNLIISDIRKFIWISIFLSDKLEDILSISKLVNVKLFSASLRSAPFVSTLGLISNIPFETIDRFGPKHKVFDIDFLNRIERDTDYIYIGDFSFGGTEIKLARTYIEMRQSRIKNALVIGNYLEAENFSDEIKLNSLISLKNLNHNSNYTL